MCGIVGYIGSKSASIKLLDLIQNLEYRGYDSAGIAVFLNKKIKITKRAGKIQSLRSQVRVDNSLCGIAHTRWATHGKPNKINAHPHIGANKEWAVVHNGIIENFEKLRKDLEKNENIHFISETDTEVIPQLMESLHNKNKIDDLIDACNLLQGSFAIVCINKHQSDTLFLAKRKSPLYISLNKDEVFVASDPICFSESVTEYYALDDDQFCVATKGKVVFYDKNKNVITKNQIRLGNIKENSSKEKYKHYMIKEICETPCVLKSIIKLYSENNHLQVFNRKFIKKFDKIEIVGCGTAYHAGLVGATFIREYAKIEANVQIASEFRYSKQIINKKTLCLFISQSGETADTLIAERLAKRKGATTVAITNMVHSTLAKNVDIVLPIYAGYEIAVASTKAYSSQLIVLYMLAKHLKQEIENKNIDYIKTLQIFAKKLRVPKKEELKKIVQILVKTDNVFFIGRGVDFITAKEACLKLKETSYINCLAYPAGELKHGYLALIDNKKYLFVIATDKKVIDKTLSNAHEAYARGAKIVLITQINLPEEKIRFIDRVIKLQKCNKELMPIVAIITMQCLSYYTSIKKGINPDQPRNLAKSVTVE